MNGTLGAALYWTAEGIAGNGVLRRLVRLRRNERRSRDEIRALQGARLRDIVAYAHANVPHYRRAMDDLGVRPSDIRGLEDLPKLPLLSKRTLADEGDSIRARDAPRGAILVRRTGGTTGIPVTVRIDRSANGWETASYWRGCAWAGYRPGDPVVRLVGGSLSVGTSLRRHALKRRLLGEIHLPAFEIGTATARSWADAIERHGTRVLIGYGSALVAFGEALRDVGREVRVPIVLPKAEKVDATMRHALEDAYGGRVFDAYGSGEATGIAHECEAHAGLHVSDDVFVVESLDDRDRPTDGAGRAAVTSLWNRAMPLLRYVNDDLVDLGAEPCPCGRPFSLIREIQGRANDSLIRSDGSRVPPVFAPHLFQKIPEVRRGQIVQDRIGALRIRLVLDPAADRASVEERMRRAAALVIPDLEIAFEYPDEILGAGDAKFRAQLCNVADSRS